jgi:hypothetical protein
LERKAQAVCAYKEGEIKMPCYDSRVEDERNEIIDRLNKATRIACELSYLLSESAVEKLSDEAVDWIIQHRVKDELIKGKNNE